MYRVTQSVKIGNLNGKVINGIGKGTWNFVKKKVSMFCVIKNIFYTVEYNSERYASLKAGIFLGIVACTFPASSSVPACKASSASFDMPLSTGVSFRRSNGT